MQRYSWMSTHSGRLEDCTAPSFSKGCLCMLLRWGGRKWRGLSAKAISMACQGQTQRSMYLLFSLWGTKPPRRRFRTSTMKYTYWKGYLAYHPAGPNGWKRPSKTFRLPWGATYEDEEVLLCWRSANGSCCGHSMAQLPNRIPLPVPRERLPTQWSPPGGKGDSPVGIGGSLHAGVKYQYTEQGSRWHPTSMPLQLQLPSG